ncbi:flagellar basal body-associated FliL family protein [Limnoglobus roseus]|nr:flagellar basal body-associated FliL family protein [Limnoglobus roseus]
MLLLAGLAVVLTFSVTPIPARSDPPAKPSGEDALRAKVADLETRRAIIEKKLAEPDSDTIPFGDVTVNLAEERMTGYLRVKITIEVDETAFKELSRLVEKNKAAMKSWAISHLSGKTVKDVGGTAGVERLKGEIQKQFGEILAPKAKQNPVKAILFEEYLIQ